MEIVKLLTRSEKISSLIGWRGYLNFSSRGPSEASIRQMYLLIHKNKKWRRRFVAEMRAKPEYRDILQRKPAVPGDLEMLRNKPEGSLGRAYFDFIKTHGLSLPVPGSKVPEDDFRYSIYRILNTHDLYHLLLDARPDAFGEMIVAAFTDAQLPLYLHASTHVAASIAFAAFSRKTAPRFLLRGCAVGHLLGMQAEPLFAVDWAALWDLPLEAVRQQLHIEIEKVHALANGFNQAGSVLKHPTLHDLRAMKHYGFEKLNQAGHDIHVYLPQGEIRGLCVVGRAMFTKGRYFHRRDEYNLTAALVEQGYVVAIPVPDSDREEGFVTLANRQEDIIRFLRHRFNQDPFLIGHSFSGILFAWLCREHGESLPVRGLITLSTGLWDQTPMKGIGFRQKCTLASYYLSMRVRRATGRHVAGGKFLADAFLESNAVSEQMTISPWKGHRQVPKHVINMLLTQEDRMMAPCLSLTGDKDKMMPPPFVQHFHEHYLPGAERRIYEGLGHMDIAASDRASHVWHDIAAWMTQH
ncbi:ubiquinone biosynthesis protein Coq4 [Phyllobacterium myrsinacearum]|nr:ubiquinone biosynthesis protein Coq4 [Phyllobacterium myrsinacearum]